MKDEIEEILEAVRDSIDDTGTDKVNFINWVNKIEDYITNLQESDNDKQSEIMKLKDKLEQQRKEYQETYKDVRIELKEKDEIITNLQEENERLKINTFKHLQGMYLNGFKITIVDKDPFIKGQINIFTDVFKDIGFGDKASVKFILTDEPKDAQVYQEQLDTNDLLDYKSRNEKAIKYNYELQERYCHSALFDDLVASKIYEITEKQLNILQGEGKMNKEELMRKYHYGYHTACKLVESQYVKDLNKEIERLNKELDYYKKEEELYRYYQKEVPRLANIIDELEKGLNSFNIKKLIESNLIEVAMVIDVLKERLKELKEGK